MVARPSAHVLARWPVGLADHFGRALRDEKTTSGIAESTIWRLESADDGPIGGRAATGGAIREAVERAGVIFIEENGAGPGVRLRKSRRKR